MSDKTTNLILNPSCSNDFRTNSEFSSNSSPDKRNFFFGFAIFTALIIIAIKSYIVFRFWDGYNRLDIYVYINFIVEDGFFRSIINFFTKTFVIIGLVLLSLELLFNIFLRYYMLSDNDSSSLKAMLIQLNFFMYSFIHGFLPELSFAINGIDIEKEGNFFIDFYRFKIRLEVIFISIIFICILGLLFTIFCSRGEKLGEIKTTTYYASGRTSESRNSVYDLDHEGIQAWFFLGFSCTQYFILFFGLIFPVIIGLVSYAYSMTYMKEPILIALYISEFSLNYIFIYLYSAVYR